MDIEEFKLFYEVFLKSKFSKLCNPEDLELIFSNKDEHIFKYEGNIHERYGKMIINYSHPDGYPQDPSITGTIVTDHNTETSVRFLKDSNDDNHYHIGYEFYPTDQGSEIPAKCLFSKLTPAHVAHVAHESDELNQNFEIERMWEWDDKLVCIGCTRLNISHIVYLVLNKENDKIISGFIDPNSYFQLGDSETYAWVNEYGEFVVENCGDASSIVVIKNI